MAKGSTRSGLAWKQGYSAYKAKGQYEKNRRRDLTIHLREHPNDEVAARAIKGIQYRRYKPNAKGGWVTGKVMFGMLDFVGVQTNPNCPKGIQANIGFIGSRSRAEQKKLAQFMKLDRKTANEMAHATKKERESLARTQRKVEAKQEAARKPKVKAKVKK